MEARAERQFVDRTVVWFMNSEVPSSLSEVLHKGLAKERSYLNGLINRSLARPAAVGGVAGGAGTGPGLSAATSNISPIHGIHGLYSVM